MEHFLFALDAVLPLFLLMAAGFALKLIKLVPQNFFTAANTLCFKVLLPVMLFVNICELTPTEGVDLRYIWLALGGVLGCALLSMCLLPLFVKDKLKIGVMSQAMFRSNFLIFGVPVVRNMFGDSELWATSVLLPIVIPIFNILAVVVLSIYKNDGASSNRISKTLLDILKNPLVIAALLAYGFVLFKIPIPDPVFSAAGDLGAMASPLALLALGATLRFSTIGKNLRYIFSSCFVKLLALPAIMLPLAVSMGFRGSTIGALLALFASPVAVSSYVMAEASGNDGELAGQIVAISTTASVFTMFFWVYLLRALGAL